MTVKEFIKEAIAIDDADDLLQFLTEKDFSVIEADFPIESHLAALLEYRGYDEEMMAQMTIMQSYISTTALIQKAMITMMWKRK